ncbi:MAG: hypothetical protein AAGJ40_09655 [Planctomycetota bacterium]
MSLQTELQDLVTAFVTDVRDISNSLVGASNGKNALVVSSLTTTAKNLVGAVNENKAAIDASVGAAVTSVNGSAGPGAVTIDTDAVGEGSANLYFTEARAIASLLAGYAAGAGTVSATDSVLAAIQKLDGNIQAIDLTALINDAAASTSTTYSGTKIDADIAAAVANLVGTAPGVLDTLGEIADAINDDANLYTTLTSQIALKANIADTKSVTELGAAVDTTDYSALYVAARDA